MRISTRSSKEELLFFSDPARFECSIRKEKRTSSINTTSTTSINTTSTTSIDTTSTTSIDTCDRAKIDSSTRRSIDTNPRADIVATLVLQRDENGDLHDPGGHLCNAAGQRIDGQGTAILEPSAATEDAKVPLQRSLADLTRPRLCRKDGIYDREDPENSAEDECILKSETVEAVTKQEALVKGKAVESERHQVNAISDDDFGGSARAGKPGRRCFPSRKLHVNRQLSHSDFAARHPYPPTLARVKRDNIDRQQHNVIDRQQHGNIDRQQQKSSDRQPPILYRVRLPDLDGHRLKASRNPSQTSVCLKTTEKISQQSAEAREQKQTLVETSFFESVDRRHLPGIDRRHLPGIDRHQTDGYEPAMGKQATKEEILVEKRVKSRKPYIPKHLRREVNKEELEGFHKRVKRVPKDMSFEDAYHKYRLGNFFKESREIDKDIELLFNKATRKPKRTLKKEQYPGKFLIPCSIHSHHLPNALCDTGYAVSIWP
ncbi:hypothetical protein DY000_02014557 [Brassica cretica]|uniref:TPX2 C-terminal domain-containing protein n=1 Tax=Brassica cretica TaxID=69181 RepID=A0ABQ7D8T9_BRACR|nr:hypothetical protein DY000_02014557 [Brassica cretica]